MKFDIVYTYVDSSDINWLNRLGALCVCWPSSKCLVVWCKCRGGMQGSEGRCRNMSGWLGKISTIST